MLQLTTHSSRAAAAQQPFMYPVWLCHTSGKQINHVHTLFSPTNWLLTFSFNYMNLQNKYFALCFCFLLQSTTVCCLFPTCLFHAGPFWTWWVLYHVTKCSVFPGHFTSCHGRPDFIKWVKRPGFHCVSLALNWLTEDDEEEKQDEDIDIVVVSWWDLFLVCNIAEVFFF